MKRFILFAICGLFLFLGTTGCWSARYDQVNDSDYYYYPSHPNVDYINLLAPTAETAVTPAPK
ncbi:MAG: hypothetical protein AABZ60_00360 [Planctomycetota bacterium]